MCREFPETTRHRDPGTYDRPRSRPFHNLEQQPNERNKAASVVFHEAGLGATRWNKIEKPIIIAKTLTYAIPIDTCSTVPPLRTWNMEQAHLCLSLTQPSVRPSQSNLGGVPAIYASAFARLQAQPPVEVPRDRWHQFINDAGRFLDRWGRQAEAFGWQPEELIGLDPHAPMARYDRMGLIWMLKGEYVVALTATEAKLSGGLTFYRKG